MSSARRFEDLIVWQEAADLAAEIHHIADRPAFRSRHALRDQICRASTSVMANIAEGFGRYRCNEFRRFLIISRGSAAEVKSHLYLAHRLHLIDDQEQSTLQSRYATLGRRISKLSNSLHD